MRILFVDDHDLLRDTLKAYFEAHEEFAVELASTVGEGLAAIDRDGPFDLVLLDYQIPGMDGLIGLRQIIAAQRERPVMLLTGVATEGTAAAAIRVGAFAVLSKAMSIERLKIAIISAITGKLAPGYADAIGKSNSPDGMSLTPRQEEVLRCVCVGLSNKQIARQLNLNEATIKMHLKLLYSKLGVNSRTQAIILSRDLNLL
jgi:DNA-binding NarL/FixJ family response regulator